MPPLKLLTFDQSKISFQEDTGFMNDEGMNKRSRESDGRRRGRESFGIAKDILGIAKMDGGADAPQQKRDCSLSNRLCENSQVTGEKF